MWPQYFWCGGMWFFPVIMLIVMLMVVFLIFGRGRFRPPWYDSSRFTDDRKETDVALDILKKRYAKGEITKEEFEQMKKDILN